MTKQVVFGKDTLEDLMEIAGYGIAYWARKMEFKDGTLTVWDCESSDVWEADTSALEAALYALLDVDQKHVRADIQGYIVSAYRGRDEDGLDMCEIDSVAADVWLQVALMGRVVFG